MANKPIEFEGKFEGKDGEPLPPKAPEVKLTPPPGVSDSVIPKPFEMKAKPNGEGWFSGRFQVRRRRRLHADGAKSGDRRFPDASLQRQGSQPGDGQHPAGLPDDVSAGQRGPRRRLAHGRCQRQELRRRLQRPKIEAADPWPKQRDKLRLYFRSQERPFDPESMRPDVQTLRNRGPIEDLWDDGFVIWQPRSQPITIAYWCCWPLSACCRWNG